MSLPLTFAGFHASQENNLALASLKFDFALIKCDPLPEYKAIGACLSPKRKENAEDGSLHRTARQLGALFQSELPEVPHLIRVYGQRATEILRRPDVNPRDSGQYGPFADYVGADGSTIWAAVTSGESTILMHLLACMLARMWKQPEAISIWSELIEQRQALLREKIKKQSLFEAGDLWASRIEISREQLAAWDNSARAWLRTADEAQKVQATQLRLILQNLSLPVSYGTEIHQTIISAATDAFVSLDGLVQGKSLRIQNGAVLLGLSSWHLYPDLDLFGLTRRSIKMNDSLMPQSAVVTIGLEDRSAGTDDGIYWSLSLAHMRYYGDPVRAVGNISTRGSHVTFPQFSCAFFGFLLGLWCWTDKELEVAFALIKEILNGYFEQDSNDLCQTPKSGWLRVVASVVEQYDKATDVERQQIIQLTSFGRQEGLRARVKIQKMSNKQEGLRGSVKIQRKWNKGRKLTAISPQDVIAEPFFGLFYFSYYLDDFLDSDRAGKTVDPARSLTNSSLKFLRNWASASKLVRFVQSNSDVIIVSTHPLARHHIHDCFPHDSLSKKRKASGEEARANSSLYRSWLTEDHVSPVVGDETGSSSSGQQDVRKTMWHDPDTTFRLASQGLFPPGPDEPLESYSFLCGNLWSVAIFCRTSLRKSLLSQLERNNAAERMSANDLLLMIRNRSISRHQIRKIVGNFFSLSYRSKSSSLLNAVSLAQGIYSRLPGALMSLDSLRRLSNLSWVDANLDVDVECEMALESVFACIVFFESGSIDLDPTSLQGVIAISAQNSLYIAEHLLEDPYNLGKPSQRIVRRVTGSIGKPGISILFSPSNPMVSSPGRATWQVAQNYFDGMKEDSFADTSCHLSLTKFQAPINTNDRGLRDSECTLLETAISAFDRGQWVADLDVQQAYESLSQYCLSPCLNNEHTESQTNEISALQQLLSVDSWHSLLDTFPREQIVRAHSNSGARLAAACVALQKKHRLVILPLEPCWKCVGDELREFKQKASETSVSEDSDLENDMEVHPGLRLSPPVLERKDFAWTWLENSESEKVMSESPESPESTESQDDMEILTFVW